MKEYKVPVGENFEALRNGSRTLEVFSELRPEVGSRIIFTERDQHDPAMLTGRQVSRIVTHAEVLELAGVQLYVVSLGCDCGLCGRKR